MNSLRLLSPAKLNLFFRVLSKRSDGYHDIASLYSAVSLFDSITISHATNDRFTSSDPHMEEIGGQNLIIKARELFRERSQILDPIEIHLDKRIPAEMGLGGGSSNAATVLWAMNELLERPLSLEDLSALGAELGSDISFFFSKGLAYCTGRGEIFQSMPQLEHLDLYLVMPNHMRMSTPKVYQSCRPDEVSTENPEMLLVNSITGNPQFVNDLEGSAFRLQPELKSLKEELLESFEHVCMTGSGSAFFCYKPTAPITLNDATICEVSTVSRSEEWYRNSVVPALSPAL